MITNTLLDHAALVPAALLLVCLGSALLGHALLRARRARTLLGAVLGLSVLPVLALTLVPAARPAGEGAGCTVQFALPTPGSVELLANVALFVPPDVLATLLTRRPLLVLLVAAGVSAAIETLQALLPALARACDTNDWAMDTAGATIGVLLATGVLALSRPRTTATRA
ncbi:VanZ family protein [Modestobacter sp. VKM Ac-2986]|uniref:VanZ family protein n=1 Tax=Modestobacter sp. VKM Ac-2986 TaxID=3004140 RepID=UPI0022ABBFD4|nr:VanZ family protein [Modestobacter sp. VKM Ac-2986]MCZ2829376.1 VanZ family protein [Modestobacter sp. VKM Ac-2986]